MANDESLQTFLANYDKDQAAQALGRPEEDRQAFVKRFPLDEWSGLTKEQYAQGHSGGPESFVSGLQTTTKSIAAVFLGDAINGLIYFSKKQNAWVSFWSELSPEEAWERTRAAWLLAFDYARAGNWTAIDAIDDLKPARVLVLKALYIYFPNDILPTNSENHARKFLRALGHEVDPSLHFVSLNRQVLAVAREVPEFDGWTSYQINRFLYEWIDPSGKGSRGQPIIWWVNQGATYLHERDGGYLWAPQRSTKDGGARPHWQAMTEIRPGDRIVHYKDKAIRGVSEATSTPEETARPSELPSEAWGQEGWLVRTSMSELAEPFHIDSIPTEFRTPENGPFDINGGVKQGYLFKLSDAFGKELAKRLEKLPTVSPGPRREKKPSPTSGLLELSKWTYLPEAELEELIELLRARRQLILQGPPGAGKTWVAEALGRHLTDNPLEGETNSRFELVQFHQSYGYEDFMQGIRPQTVDGRLEYQVLPGILMRFISQEDWNGDVEYVLLIDEINRGNISRIFGELLLLLEYRNKQVRLPYASSTDRKFELPANLLIIGTMNTADRSLASIDYALRRRFAFHRLSPVEHGEAPVLSRWLKVQGGVDALQRDEVLRLFLALNQHVESEMGSGGEDFQIGHSYFMTQQVFTELGRERIWRTSIRPLLEEYFANRKQREELLDAFEPLSLLADSQPDLDEFIEEDVE